MTYGIGHRAASLLLAENVQPRDIMEVLGHSQIGLTMNLYSHVMKPSSAKRRRPDGQPSDRIADPVAVK